MNRYNKICLNSLIVFYLGVIYFAGVPESNTLNFRLKEKANKIAFAVGIWPSWSMFAPNPVKFDSKSYVEVIHKNGDINVHDVEVPLSGILAPFRKARWMKYSQDNLRNPKQRVLLGPALKHFHAKYDSLDNPIVSIQIKRKWLEVAPFNHKSLASIYETPRIEKQEILITHKVGN